MSERKYYTKSNGSRLLISEMPTPYLKNAFSKLRRDFEGHPELPGMADEIARRDEEFAAAQEVPAS